MLSVAEARAKVLEAFEPLGTIEVKVADALGFVLAADIRAPHSLPRFDNSAMDGFAVIAAETAGASKERPVHLKVVGEMRAGSPSDVKVDPGSAVRIMTGAPVPEGADAVVPVEMTGGTDEEVEIHQPVVSGTHIRPAGDDLARGDLLVGRGVELGPGELALLASMGASPMGVHRRPRVAILVTGDELVAPEAEPAPGQIRDSNSIALRSLVIEAGAEPIVHPPVPDDRSATVEAFRTATEGADLIVSSGGVAVGRYDFVKEVIEELGRIDMWKVAMQPGKPVVLGAVGNTPFLGLPGNPVSIHVAFEQFVRPAIRKMRGCSALLRPLLTARLTERIDKKAGRMHFVRVRLDQVDGRWFATPTGPQGSHIQSSLIGCDGVARFEAGETRLEMGAEVVVELWRLPEGDPA